MYEAKTKPTSNNVMDFLNQIEPSSKKEDAIALLHFFEEVTGYPAIMWGETLIGFGTYHYKYPTKHEGDAPIVGFSPRKNYISLYFSTDEKVRKELLSKLGKHKALVACVHINKLRDIDLDILKQLILESITFLENYYPNNN